MIIPYTPPEGRRGSFFTTGDGPTEGEECSFWIQQYPSFGTPYGRITVDITDRSLEHHSIVGVVRLFVTWVLEHILMMTCEPLYTVQE